ncbi:XisI protein [Coleofasciculus sp. LEGE 07092]|nr:XisI protein [Coleofasciculus sp. LEGE 07081]MBE9151634.1 XisI protein [Coleofasciculus sp. LEGE 07092]
MNPERELIKSILEKHSRCDCEDHEVETQIAFDIERDRYLCKHLFTG